MARQPKRPGPKPRPKPELQRNRVVVMLTDNEWRQLADRAKDEGKRPGTLAREVLVRWLPEGR